MHTQFGLAVKIVETLSMVEEDDRGAPEASAPEPLSHTSFQSPNFVFVVYILLSPFSCTGSDLL